MEVSILVAFKMIRFGIIIVTFIVYCYAITSDEMRATLPDGSKLVGRYLKSVSGRGIRSFLGLPYAQPPIGELRFQPPQKVKPLKGEFRAHQDGPLCLQINTMFRETEVHGQEDCLYLNVFAPQVVDSPLPVMVFFHGGGFTCGGGTRDFYEPDYILEHDVVLVGVNFRLGPLGFLSTEQEDCYGNWGLKDQLEALQWIKANIASFGGDPKNVVIFGESAGGSSVTFHMQSSLSEGLFHKAISQSGTNLGPWGAVAHKGVAQSRAKRLAEMLNCKLNGEKYDEMIDCLRRKRGEDITKALLNFYVWDVDPLIPFTPVVEPIHDGAFITENPRFANPHGNNVPWITGINSEEGLLKTAAFLNNKNLRQNLNDNWELALPVSLFYDHLDKKKQKRITKQITDFYFNGTKLTDSNQNRLTDVYTDNWFLAPLVDYLKIRFQSSNYAQTYVYVYTHRGCCSFTDGFQGDPEKFYGTAHSDDLLTLFPIEKTLSSFFSGIPTDDDMKIKKIMTKLFVNFAYTGHPTPMDTTDLKKWDATNTFPLEYMRLGNGNGKKSDLMEMSSDLYPSRANFWNLLNDV